MAGGPFCLLPAHAGRSGRGDFEGRFSPPVCDRVYSLSNWYNISVRSLWIAIGHYTDDWTSGQTFHAWGACLQQGNDPKKAYVRTWGCQAGPVAAGGACGPLLVAGKDTTESPFKVRGPGSNLADHTLLEVLANGELLVGSGYRLAEIVGASNPSGWSGCIKVKNPSGVTARYILLYSSP